MLGLQHVFGGLLLSLCLAGTASGIHAQESIPFDSPRWEHAGSEVVEIGGRQALQGTAILRDLEFRDGVVEYDVFLSGGRSYPGVYFRLTEDNFAEHFYVRPHRAGLYPDALQYAPVVAGIAEWQFYNGPGYTAPITLPDSQWIPVRLEIKGTQARVFVDDFREPALVIPHLEGHSEAGTLALTGPTDGTAFFSNFRYRTDVTLDFELPVEREIPEGMIESWQVSQAIPMDRIGREAYPNSFSLFRTDWRVLEADERGLVDIADRTPRQNPEGDVAIARHVFFSEGDQLLNLNIGYSDEIDLFFNGQRVFSGKSRYQGRDPSFLGILGLHDQVPVQARRGLNEILIMVTEVFGGWGFMVQAEGTISPKPTDHEATEEVWTTPDAFLTPESVLKDPDRDVLYVTSFDTDFAGKPDPSGFISRLALDGEILDLKWVEGVNAPAGMDIWRDTLYVAERQNLMAVEIESGEVVGRWPIPDADFPNDVVIDENGTVYISDTRSSNPKESRVYRFRNGEFDVFVEDGIDRANGLWIHEGGLLVGNTGDGFLKRVDLETGRMENLFSVGAGILDGIRVDDGGNLLVSRWGGQVFRVSSSGAIQQILDAEALGWNTADFEYLPEDDLLVIPTFFDNRVRAVRILR